MKELIQSFYEPGKVFDAVRERRIWAPALIATIIVTLAVSVYVINAIGFQNVVRHQIESSSLTKNLSPEQKEQAIQGAATPTREKLQYVFIAVGTVIFMCIFALIFMAIGAISGGKVKFMQGFGLACYASWPFSLLRGIMTFPIVAMSADKENLDAQNVVAMNIAAFLDKATTAKPLYTVASFLDLFIIGQMIYAAYGLSKVAGISFTKAVAWIAAIWFVIMLIAVGFSAIF
jgi:hypothetical protein